MGFLTRFFSYRFRSLEGREELVEIQPWTWEAGYNDGTVLKQYDDQRWFHRSSEVDTSCLKELRILYHERPVLTIQWFPGMTFTYLRRRRLLDHGSPHERLITAGVFSWTIRDLEIYAVGTKGGRLTVTTDLDKASLE